MVAVKMALYNHQHSLFVASTMLDEKILCSEIKMFPFVMILLVFRVSCNIADTMRPPSVVSLAMSWSDSILIAACFKQAQTVILRIMEPAKYWTPPFGKWEAVHPYSATHFPVSDVHCQVESSYMNLY